MPKTINLRDVDDGLVKAAKRKALDEDTSLKGYIVGLVEKDLKVSGVRPKGSTVLAPKGDDGLQDPQHTPEAGVEAQVSAPVIAEKKQKAVEAMSRVRSPRQKKPKPHCPHREVGFCEDCQLVRSE